MHDMRVVILPSFEAVSELDWDDLLSRSGSCSVFQSYGWLTAWWSSFATSERKLFIPAVFCQDMLIAAAPLFIEEKATRNCRRRFLRFVGEEHADYINVLSDRAYPQSVEVLIQSTLSDVCEWDVFHIPEVPEQSPLDLLLRARVLDRTVHLQRGSRTPCPGIAISQHRPEVEALLNKKSVKRHVASLSKVGALTVEHLTDSGNIHPLLPHFFTQHIERWAVTNSPSLFENELNRRFYRCLADALCRYGQILFTVLRLDGTPIAYHFGLISGNSLIWYKPSFDITLFRFSPGEVLLREIICLALSRKCDELDFTRGDEAFKQRFGNHVNYNQSWIWYRQTRTAVKAKLRHVLRTAIRPVIAPTRVFGAVSMVRRTVRQRQEASRATPVLTLKFLLRFLADGLSSLVQFEKYHLRKFEMNSGSMTASDVEVFPATLRMLLDHYTTGVAPAISLPEAFARLKHDDECFLLRANRQVVGYAWVARKAPVHLQNWPEHLSFPEDEICLYDLCLCSEKDIPQVVLNCVGGILQGLQRRKLWFFYRSENGVITSALASLEIPVGAGVSQLALCGGYWRYQWGLPSEQSCAKLTVKRVLLQSSVAKSMLAALSRHNCRIFMYHRFSSKPQAGMVDRVTMAAQLDEMKAHFQVVHLHEFFRQWCAGRRDWRKTCVITIDDGYGDFYQNAYPLLRDRGLPATVFITTGFVGHGTWLWWDAIRYLVENTTVTHVTIEHQGAGPQLVCRSPLERQVIYDHLVNYCARISQTDQRVYIKALEDKLHLPLPPKPTAEYAPCTIGQLNEMATHGITFGAHTVNHPILTACSADEWQKEILQSREDLTSWTKGTIDVFAYPNGTIRDYSESMAEFLQDNRFLGAVTAHYDEFHAEGLFTMRRCEASTFQDEFLWKLWGGEYVARRLKERISVLYAKFPRTYLASTL